MNYAANVNENLSHLCDRYWTLVCYNGLFRALNRLKPLDAHSTTRHNLLCEPWRSMPANSKTNPTKVKALLEEGTLNPSPGKVHDSKFQKNEFFDPRDLVQVKYEMLRRGSIEKASVTEATEEYGVSRPTYYQTKAYFDKAGVAGLVPQKRGPHGPHKLQGEALAFVQQQLVAGQLLRARELAKLVTSFSTPTHKFGRRLPISSKPSPAWVRQAKP